ncbi:hypothetical protein DR64_7650 [Paraburkholderia xenovorans LB400]|uniref:DUF4148 domain-containing protein n=1 Tax=Paraburkholderia xenovorans (strain LB400) TaxID=266265 RepID=Q13GW4_PARXL|nr:DUF4148 domain-containing protein [Paraburkholderia xenovorans]ABE36675.1 hypothetical protein Bxe_C0694 [Paraburkholderia xenovorans LB400]AIP34999.1 hypothetical protein DR64_7650 [Paraburkholderia xenovorans LB400]
MSGLRVLSVAIAAVACLNVTWVLTASAQASDTGASTPKQIRKAQRKQARVRKNAELKDLEKNGYRPGEDQLNYPQNIQQAQKKVNESKAAPSP